MLQKVINLISPLLFKIRYSSKKNPFKILSEILGKNSDYQKNTKGLILIAPLRVSPTSNLFEALIGKYFQIKGYTVKSFMCNQLVIKCENIQETRNKYLTCALCLKEQRKFESFLGIESIKATDYVSSEERKKIRAIINEKEFVTDDDFVFDGVNLKEYIISAYMRYRLRSEVPSYSEPLFKQFAYTSFLFARATTNIIKLYKIDRLIISHGIYGTWGTVLEVFKKHKIPSLVWGRGYIGQGNLIFGHNMSYAEEFVKETAEVYSDIVLDGEKINIVNDYFTRKSDPNSGVDYVNYYKGLSPGEFDVKAFFDNITQYTKKYGMFTNIPWDGQMLNKTEAFPSVRSYVRSTIKWFSENPDCALIIRAHPAEKSRKTAKSTETFEELLFNEYSILPPNVFFLKPDNPITSYEVAKLIDAVTIYGSTMGLELALKKLPIIQTGKNNVSYKGIVFDAKNESDYYELLDRVRVSNLQVSEDMYNNALKYGYYWIKQRHIEDSSVNLKQLLFQSFNFSNSEELIKDQTLEFVYNKIISNSKVIKK
ncbi:hypothetical protein [Dysgonomonas macrotermitis]|uniref:Capsule polysaccharide biosynthesis protein n=1 Tax=Dysgonomonas macrotermitis TaxID=1346286 RepID=A0A1M5I3M8_9BACT|nr:hypothetical protein [Dysgonomonas macrotermitis]SHG22938.1 hypothetical protein SAMN05444362_11831 [Dysgonomonas macrotermitis]